MHVASQAPAWTTRKSYASQKEPPEPFTMENASSTFTCAFLKKVKGGALQALTCCGPYYRKGRPNSRHTKPQGLHLTSFYVPLYNLYRYSERTSYLCTHNLCNPLSPVPPHITRNPFQRDHLSLPTLIQPAYDPCKGTAINPQPRALTLNLKLGKS